MQICWKLQDFEFSTALHWFNSTLMLYLNLLINTIVSRNELEYGLVNHSESKQIQ